MSDPSRFDQICANVVFATCLLKFGYPGNSIFSSSVNLKNYALLVAQCLWRKSTLLPHIHGRNIILQMCSCTLQLLHAQTRSNNGLYRLYMSSECKENMTFAFREKNEQSRANVEIAPYLLPHCLWYKCILSHTFSARENTLQMYSFTLHLPAETIGW